MMRSEARAAQKELVSVKKSHRTLHMQSKLLCIIVVMCVLDCADGFGRLAIMVFCSGAMVVCPCSLVSDDSLVFGLLGVC